MKCSRSLWAGPYNGPMGVRNCGQTRSVSYTFDLHWSCLSCTSTAIHYLWGGLNHQFCPHQRNITNTHQPEPLVLSPLMLFQLASLGLFFTSNTIIASSMFLRFSFICLIIFYFFWFILLSFFREVCTCSSYLTTIQLVGCPCSSWSSLSVSLFHGSMVNHTFISVIFLKIFFHKINREQTFLPFVAD